MARSIATISAAIDAQIAIDIPSLNSPSLTAIWRLFRYVVAAAIRTHEVMWDLYKQEVNAIAAASVGGTERWYADQMLKFQYGFPLIFNPSTYKYYYLDTTSSSAVLSRIIKHVATVKTSGGTVIKIAGETIPGTLNQLSGGEVTAAAVYLDRIEWAGARISLVSLPADGIRFKAKIYYDGTLDLTAFKASFEPVFKDYLKNIFFNGAYNTTHHVDACQEVSGFIDIFFDSIEVSVIPGIWSPVSREYIPSSGYFEMVPIDVGVDDTNLQYIATV